MDMSHWAPIVKQTRDPRDAKKKNGMFWNFPRYMYFGGAPGPAKLDQSGTKAINAKASDGQNTFGGGFLRGK